MKSKKKTEKKQKKNFTYKISYRFPFYQRYMNVHKLLFISLCFFFFAITRSVFHFRVTFRFFVFQSDFMNPSPDARYELKKNQTKQKEEKKK